MKRLFGAAKAEPKAAGPAPSLSDASSKADARITDLDTKIKRCDEDLRRYMAPGKQQKTLAMQVLKRKKMYEQQRDQILGTQFNIDFLAGAQEQAELTVTSVEAMKAGQADLKQRYKAMGGIDDIERLMDGMADLNDEIQEINEVMSTAFAVPDGFNEADCDAEFAALEEEMAFESLAGVSSSAATPAVPAYLEPAGVPAPLPAAGAGDAGYGGGGGGGGGGAVPPMPIQ
jgi:charged multivesicular body protein 5